MNKFMISNLFSGPPFHGKRNICTVVDIIDLGFYKHIESRSSPPHSETTILHLPRISLTLDLTPELASI